ncbi:heterokaryon incompatibility protein [Colletotrichum karsti]|uniref:Heterokaryon incompatibility protein n=1 Tax=Colletotrichum karsti TaxID=1095194 RepID=A0A9P6LH44_9PEZI|nr:heterokaryon incompatibility protein [Colletotrichum karsti]KAF9872851.1 heterokaryon incompatibility protein [Colletotrichum karsti]
MSTFQYRKELRGQEIRLLCLLPGDWLDDLKAELYVADQTHQYAALSYAWGSSRKSNQIIVNSEVQYITFNLDRALRAIRRPTSPVTIWVDSICINQKDAAEKSNQVGLMHDIFGSATQVFAYIGDGLDRSRKDYPRRFNILRKSSFVHFTGKPDDLPLIENSLRLWRDSPPGSLSEHEEILCLCSVISAPLHVESPETLQQLLPGQTTSADEQRCRQISERIRLFAVSDWWNRMWIIQEACVAKELTITYGRVSIPFKAIVQGARRFLDQFSSNSSELGKVVSYLVGKTDTIDFLRVRGSYRASALATNSALLWLLRNFRNRRSSEPRDKVFALLRLADGLRSENVFSHVELYVDTDYRVSVKELFSRVTHQIIRQTGLLWVTTFDLLAKRGTDMPSARWDVPTWVPDWSSDYLVPGWNQQRITLHGELFQGFNSSRARFRHLKFGAEDRIVLPQEHFQRLADGYVDPKAGWETVHYVPAQIDSVDPDGHDLFLLSAPGVSCGKVDGVSDAIASSLSNLGDVIRQLILCYWPISVRGQVLHREPLLEVVARCLCYGIRTEARPDGYNPPRGLNPSEMREITCWTLRRCSSNISDPSISNFASDLMPKVIALKPEHELTIRTECEVENNEPWYWSNLPKADNPLDDLEHGLRLMNFSQSVPDFNPEDSETIWAKDQQWMEDTVRAVAGGFRLFVTSKGQIGLGPERMRQGDEVCILQGGLMPYILRRRSAEDPSVTMVGTCYAEGIMHWGDEARGYGDDPGDIEGLEHKVRRKMRVRNISEEEFLIY